MKKKAKKKAEVQKVIGRPSSYKPEYAHMVYCMSLAGMIDIEMAEVFEVSEVTFNAWKKRYPDFLKSLKRGKAIADSMVAERLFERCMGYEHEAVKFFQHEGTILSKKYTQHYPPDVTACIFWLKNRMKREWRETMEHQVGLTFPELMKRGLLKAKELKDDNRTSGE